MKLVSILILMFAMCSSIVLAEGGNMGAGGRGIDGTVRTNTVKGTMTTEDDDPPACTPSSTVDCDGNMGAGGRSVLIFVKDYLIALLG